MTRSSKPSQAAPKKPEPAKETEDERLRLELLRLAHTPAQPVDEVIGRVQRLEFYVKNGSDNPLE